MIWCLHGAVGMAADWEGLANTVGTGSGEVRPIDLWKFLAPEGRSLEEAAVALNAEARQAGEETRKILVGYSMGGRLALHALLKDPSFWDGAVIVSAHPGLEGEEERMMRMARDAEWAGKALTADWGQFLDEWSAQAVLSTPGEAGSWGDRALLEDRRQEVARGFMEWSLGKQEDLRKRLGEIACPVVWVTGERDKKFSALGEEGAALLPRGEHCVVADAGHRVPWEAPGAFAEIVTRVARGDTIT